MCAECVMFLIKELALLSICQFFPFCVNFLVLLYQFYGKYSISSRERLYSLNMPIINYKNVDIHIDSKIILENVTFNLNAGEFAYLVGAVGSGKSSLIKTIYGEVAVHSGDAILFDKFDMRKLRRSKLPPLRKQIGIVFQDFQLLTDRNVHDNLDFVLRCTGWKKKKEREARIVEVLELVELAPKGYKMPHELSGGEQQRVVIARAILNRPKLLLADEPTGNLDNETGHKIMKLLHRICREDGTAVLMITHNEHWLEAYPAYEFRCAGGCLKVEKGSEGLSAQPVNPASLATAAKEIIAALPVVNSVVVAAENPAASVAENPAAAPVTVVAENPVAAPAAVVAENPVVAPAAVVAENSVAAPAAVVVENPAAAPAAVVAENSVAAPATVVAKNPAAAIPEAGDDDAETVDC